MEITDRKLWLFGLLIDCPMGNPLPECPANKYRHLSVTEKLDFVNSLSTEQIEDLLNIHKECLEKREKSILT
ncbi:MAG: hypothetical protein HQ541_01280 [Mariniphaga sp.]|nr:hypothetical protein [Mariniphaga sp.]